MKRLHLRLWSFLILLSSFGFTLKAAKAETVHRYGDPAMSGDPLAALIQPEPTWLFDTIEKGILALALLVALASIIGSTYLRLRDRQQPHSKPARKTDTLATPVLHDRLTRLPNQKLLLKKLEEAATANPGTKVALLHVDLGNLHAIADEVGQRTANRLLLQVTRIIANRCRQNDFIARSGADAIVIWPVKTPKSSELRPLAERLATAINRPIYIDRREYRISARIGVALQPAENAWKALVGANLASHQAKQTGDEFKVAYSRPVQPDKSLQAPTGEDLLQALEMGQFQPHYQPRHDALTRNLTGLEVLARWNHPEHGLLPPHRFIELARQLNLLNRLEQSIFEQAIEDCKIWLSEHHHVPELSFNLGLLGDQNSSWLIKEQNIPVKIGIELSDSVLQEHGMDQTIVSVMKLREMGAKIVLDGFGGAPCSVSNLLSIKPDRVKLETRLVRKIVHSAQSRQRVASLIEIGSSFCPNVGAVGVETREHAQILSQAGCKELQGFFTGKPVPGSEMAAIFARQPKADVIQLPV